MWCVEFGYCLRFIGFWFWEMGCWNCDFQVHCLLDKNSGISWLLVFTLDCWHVEFWIHLFLLCFFGCFVRIFWFGMFYFGSRNEEWNLVKWKLNKDGEWYYTLFGLVFDLWFLSTLIRVLLKLYWSSRLLGFLGCQMYKCVWPLT